MLRRLTAVAAISATLSMTIGTSKGFASADLKAETPTAATAKRMSAEVSVNNQIAPKLNSSLKEFDKFGMRCISDGKNPIPALITDVASESPAYRKGLQSGDGIVALKSSASAYTITVDRKGKLYSVTLSSSDLAPSSPLNAGTARLASALQTSGASTAFLNGGVRGSGTTARVSQTNAAMIDVEQHPFAINEIASERHSGVIQGPYGNCWFEASLSAVADSPKGPEALSKMITMSSSSYSVKFPNVPESVPVSDAEIASANLRDPSKWAAVLELAEREVYPDNSPSRGALIGNPGIKVGLELLTGKTVSFVRPDSMSPEELSSLLDRLHSEGQPITVASKSPGEHRQHIQPVVPNHAYSVVDFNRNTGLITLRNPLGNPGPGGNGLVSTVSQDEIQIDLATFSTFFRFVAYPN